MLGRARIVAVLVVLIAVLSACDWPMFGHDLAQTRASPDTSISKSPRRARDEVGREPLRTQHHRFANHHQRDRLHRNARRQHVCHQCGDGGESLDRCHRCPHRGVVGSGGERDRLHRFGCRLAWRRCVRLQCGDRCDGVDRPPRAGLVVARRYKWDRIRRFGWGQARCTQCSDRRHGLDRLHDGNRRGVTHHREWERVRRIQRRHALCVQCGDRCNRVDEECGHVRQVGCLRGRAHLRRCRRWRDPCLECGDRLARLAAKDRYTKHVGRIIASYRQWDRLRRHHRRSVLRIQCSDWHQGLVSRHRRRHRFLARGGKRGRLHQQPLGVRCSDWRPDETRARQDLPVFRVIADSRRWERVRRLQRRQTVRVLIVHRSRSRFWPGGVRHPKCLLVAISDGRDREDRGCHRRLQRSQRG